MARTADDGHILKLAKQQAEERGFFNFTIVDADAHHVDSLKSLVPYMDGPWRRTVEHIRGKHYLLPLGLGDRPVAGRIKRRGEYEPVEVEGVHPVFEKLVTANQYMGIDYAIVFPTDLLTLGLHPQVEAEVALARAYARWMTEECLPTTSSIKSMLYLPFNDPDASLKIVEEFGDKPGVVGFMVTSLRYQPVHHNKYLKVYRALEERGLPIGFHPITNWAERSFEQFNRFLSVHALGFPFYNMIHITNLVVNGIPERFPKLKFIFFECGITYLPFLMYRLDHEYRLRSSEAPLLKKLPSEYIKDFYFTTQPLEMPDKMEHLEALFDMIDGKNTLLYSSDYPHWDFDLPRTIWDLPFLDEQAKKNILGGNAIRLFGLEDLHAGKQEGQQEAV